MLSDWINLVLSIVPEGVGYINKQGGVYEIYYPTNSQNRVKIKINHIVNNMYMASY